MGWAKQVALKSSFRFSMLGPFDPAAEVLGFDGVAVDGKVAELAVHRVEVDPVPAGDEGEGLLEVGPELVDGAGPARIRPGDLKAAAGQAAGLALEAAHVVALPAVDRQGDRLQAGQRLFRIDAVLGIAVAGRCIGLSIPDGSILNPPRRNGIVIVLLLRAVKPRGSV